MIFRSIRLKNYSIYAGLQVIEPAVGSKGIRNITLIGGLNGRGKTSLLDAVLLALYGNRTPSLKEQGKAYSSYLESLVHRSASPDEDSFIELEFDAPLGNYTAEIRLRRSWRAANKRFIDRLEVWRDGVSDSHLADNWASHIEELLPSGLAGLFFFDGEKLAALAETDETGDGLKHSIRSLLGLDLVDRLIADMGTVIRKNQAKLKDVTAREEIDRLYAQRQELERRRAYTLQKLADLKGKIDQAEAKRQEKEQSFYESGGRLAEERQALRARELELTERYQEHKAEAASVAGGAAPLLLVLPMLCQIQANVDRESSVMEAQSALRLLRERDKRLLAHLSQTVGDLAAIEAAKDWMNREQSALERLAGEALTLNLSAAGSVQLNQLLDSVKSIRDAAFGLRIAASNTTTELEQVRDHLDIHIDEDRLHVTLTELAELTRTIERVKHQRDAMLSESLTIQRDLDQVERRISQLASALADVEDAERIVSYAGRTQETMRIYREKATRQKVNILTREIASAFDTLTHKTTLVSSIHMNTETLRISLHDVDGREILKDRLSSGEKQMLAIAILWGLAKATGRTLPVIIDTPMGRLDSSHRMNFVTKYLPNASHQVIVLSTDTEIVGPYLESLNGSIGRTYLLRYDEELRRTEVMADHYFEPVGGDVR